MCDFKKDQLVYVRSEYNSVWTRVPMKVTKIYESGMVAVRHPSMGEGAFIASELRKWSERPKSWRNAKARRKRA